MSKAEHLDEGWGAVTARIEAEKRAAGMVMCPACHGDGIPEDDDADACSTCDGDGWVFPDEKLN